MEQPSRGSLGEAIRKRRLELGWTQEQLAERISSEGEFVRQSEVSRLESGRVSLPRRARLERIALALDLSLGELLARSGWSEAEESFPVRVGPQNDRPLPVEANPSSDERADVPEIQEPQDRESGVTGLPRRNRVARVEPTLRSGLQDAMARLQVQTERLERNRVFSESLAQLIHPTTGERDPDPDSRDLST